MVFAISIAWSCVKPRCLNAFACSNSSVRLCELKCSCMKTLLNSRYVSSNHAPTPSATLRERCLPNAQSTDTTRSFRSSLHYLEISGRSRTAEASTPFLLESKTVSYQVRGPNRHLHHNRDSSAQLFFQRLIQSSQYQR